MYVVKRKLRSALGDKVDSSDMANLLQHTQSNPVNPSVFQDELTLNRLTVKHRNKIPVGTDKYDTAYGGGHQDFTDFAELDPNSHIEKTATRVTWAGLSSTEDAYIYKSMGDNFFGGDFTHLLTVESTAVTNDGRAYVWGLTNVVNDMKGIDDANGSYLSVFLFGASDNNLDLYIEECDSGTIHQDSYATISLNTPYYLKIVRDESVGTYGTFYCYVYTDTARATLVDTLQITLSTSKKNFRYLFATNTRNSGIGGRTISGYAENLEIIDMSLVGYTWGEGSNLRSFDENAVERKYLHTADVDDIAVNEAFTDPISSNWAFDHVAAADPHTGYVLESLLDAKGDIYAASADNTPAKLTIGSNNTYLVAASGETAGVKWQTIPATDVEVSELSTATYDDVQDYVNFFGDRTLLSGGAISDNGDGTVTVAAGTAWCKETDSDTAVGKFFDFSADNSVSLTDMITNHIYVDYNGGTPQVVVATDITTHGFKQDHIHIGIAFRDGTASHFHQTATIGIGRINRADMHHREEVPVHRANGITTSSIGTRNLGITTGVLYEGMSRHTTSPFDTPNSGTADATEANKLHDADGGFAATDVGKTVHNTTDDTYAEVTAFVDSGELTLDADIFISGENYDLDSFTYWYTTDSGSTWTEVLGATAISNSQYNNIASGLANLTSNRYGVHWVYMEVDGEHFHVLYGQGDYKANQAEEATVPSISPDIVNQYCALIAKIICQEGTDTLIIMYPWTDVFISTLATDHGSLGGLSDVADHAYALLHNGTRALSGAWDMGSQNLTNVNIDGGTIDGVTITQPDINEAVALTATATELNLLDLAALTAGELLVATGAAAAAWQSTGVKLVAPDISGSVTATSALTLPAHKLSGSLDADGRDITNVDDITGRTTDFINIVGRHIDGVGVGIVSQRTAANTGIGIQIRTYNVNDAQRTRLTFTSGIDEAVAACSTLVWTGFKLGGVLTLNAQNLVSDTTTGTEIATAANQKLGFFGTTPVIQQAGVAVTAVGIHAALVNLGLITA